MTQDLATLTDRLRAVADIYAERTGIARDADWYLLKIGEELGELTAEYLRLKGGKRMMASADETRREFEDEAADLLAQVLLFVAEEGIDIEAALHRKWLRYLDAGDARGDPT